MLVMKALEHIFKSTKKTLPACIVAMTCFGTMDAVAGDREQAKRLHERIAGVPPTATDLNYMATQIGLGNDLAAAERALENESFYSVTLKNFAAPWTNEAMDPFVALNDYSATVIGLVLEDRDFRTLLYDDVVYIGDSGLGLTPYSVSNNDHYEELEASGASFKDNLVRTTQSSVNGLPSDATAGIMTSRAAAQAYFSAGTNRAMFRFTMMHHLCNDMEQVNDTTRSPDRIRQDVSRSPGGDSRIFLNSCIGCHAGMDPMAQAFAYYDFEYDADNDPEGLLGRLIYNTIGTIDTETGDRVQGKYRINATTFPYGYVTQDDRWDNYWREGQNTVLGWDNALDGFGNGAKSMGQELAHSDAFAECQVKKVFKNVCLRDPSDSDDRNQVDSMVSSFRASGFKLKQVFAESAVYCMGS